jgi:hypothetical protein
LSPGGIGVNVATIKGNKAYDLYRDFSGIVGFPLEVWKSAHKGFKAEGNTPSYMVSPELASALYDAFVMCKANNEGLVAEQVDRLTSLGDMKAQEIQNTLLNGANRMQIRSQTKFAKADIVGSKGVGLTWINAIRSNSLLETPKGLKRKREEDVMSTEATMEDEIREAIDRLKACVTKWTGPEGLAKWSSDPNAVAMPTKTPKYKKGTVEPLQLADKSVSDSCFRVKPFGSS